jgi:protein involved in polysaccharide export with SLBB domain
MSDAGIPSGLTEDQMREMAQQRGISVPSRSASGVGTSSQTSERTRIVDTLGKLDSFETSVSGDSLDSAEWNDSLSHRRRLRRPPRDTVVPDSLQRYSQRIFRHADPSMFASHTGAVGANYQLGAGDELILTLWGQKDARYQLVLDRGGQVSVEGLGVISLNGQTLRSAESLLRKRLTRIYAGMRSGQVQMDLTLGKLKQIRVFVVGNAVRPGGYLLSGNTSVLAALYQAKGPDSMGSERRIQLARGGSTFDVDLYDYFFKGKRPRHDILQDGDVVRIPRRGALVRVRGDVGSPGFYELLPEESAKDLLQYAGGINASTAEAPLQVLRYFENGRRDAVTLPSPRKILAGAACQPLQDGDVVTVVPGRDFSRQTVHVRGEVRFPGDYPWSEHMTAGTLLQLSGGASDRAYHGRGVVTRVWPDGRKSQQHIPLDSSADYVLQPLDTLVVFDRDSLLFSDSVLISGAVRHPGRYSYRAGMTAKDLILKAGGFVRWAEFGKVRLESLRDVDDSVDVEMLDLDSSLSAAAADHPLRPFDHVAVPFNPNLHRMETVIVRGYVQRPGVYALQEPGERLSSILKRSGGIRPEGYLEAARLIRNEDSVGRISVDFPSVVKHPGSATDLEMHLGDTVYVPRRPATVKVTGRVHHPCNVVWVDGKDWEWYVEMAGGYADSSNRKGTYVQFADGSIETRENGIRHQPNPGSEVHVPFQIPEETSYKDVFSGINVVLATLIAGLTVVILLTK